MKTPEEWLQDNAADDLEDMRISFKLYLKEFLEYTMEQIKEKLEADYNILDEDICINEKDIEVFIISGKVDRIEKQILKDIGI